MKRVIVILCKGTPTGEELALRDSFVSQGEFARVVSVSSAVRDRRERERCDAAYSYHRELLQGYDNAELVAPGGVQAASSGYTITKRGRWSYVIDPKGNQVNDKGLSPDDAAALLSTL